MIWVENLGLIEGAHTGAGLGIRFLKHVERTDILLHFLDLTWMPDRDPINEYQIINSELSHFNEELGGKHQIIVINKIDLPIVRENLPKVLPWFKNQGLDVFAISSLTGEGIPPLLDRIAEALWGPDKED